MKIRTALTLSSLILGLAVLSLPASNPFSAINKLWGSSRASAAMLYAPAPTGARTCGLVTAYTPATNVAGSIKIGGLAFAIAPGASLKGVVVNQDSCFNFCFDDLGQIARQDGSPTAGQGLPQVCGIVTNFSASLGGIYGAVTIGGAKLHLAQGAFLSGQDQVAPGSNTCLFPLSVSDGVGQGSFFMQNASPKQLRIPATVRGKTFGSNSQEDIFNLPEPIILTLDSDQASVFTVGQGTFGKTLSSDHKRVEGLSYSTPNTTLQAVSCTDSFWDMNMEIASNGTTDGDMVTVNLLNPDKSVAQQIVMFTVQNGGAQITSLHPEVKLNYIGMETKGSGFFAPFLISAGTSGMRTATLGLALSQSSRAFSGCYQLAVEIKRAGGTGTTTVALDDVTVKRMERPFDRDISIGMGLTTASLGWYPTGRVCDFVCWPCAVLPPPPQEAVGLSGYVYCDTNNNGMKEAGEAGIANVEIKLLDANGQPVKDANGNPVTKKTDGNGFYQFSVIPGNYTVMETQPSGVSGDGIDKVGTCNGVAGNDMLSGINVPAGASCTDYNFGEQCASTKCDTICWRSTQFFITNSKYLPGGTVLISGVNANNPVGIQQNLTAVKQALAGGSSPMQRINKEYVTAQLSLAYSGGSGSPVVFNTFWSPLTCSGISFSPVTLSNGVSLAPTSLLDTLVTQTNLAIKENRLNDMSALADIWTLLNGRCGQ